MELIYPRESCACFTGHRTLPTAEAERVMARMEKQMIALAERGVIHYYAGGAVGFDMAAAVTVLNLKRQYLPQLTLTLALPCRDHAAKWASRDRRLMERVISLADHVVYVSDRYAPGCMQKRNIYMVDRSSVCLAYLTEGKGGTYNTVCYAERKGVPVMYLASTQEEKY